MNISKLNPKLKYALFLLLTFNVLIYSKSSLSAEIEFAPNSQSSKPSVKFNFDGEVFSPPKILTGIKETESEIEKALLGFFVANKMGDKSKFISSYAPKDRERMKEFTEGELWENNVAVFGNEISSELLAVIHYGEYVICMVANKYKNFEGYTEMVYPLIKGSDGQYYLTQDLQKDPFVTNCGFQVANKINSDIRR